jgi:hypothetical protein
MEMDVLVALGTSKIGAPIDGFVPILDMVGNVDGVGHVFITSVLFTLLAENLSFSLEEKVDFPLQ